MPMEKVIKSVNALKLAYGEIAAVEEKQLKDGSLTPKDRQIHCNIVADCMVSSSLRSNSDFSALLGISLEILFLSCSDENADVRLNTEECLNRLIKGLYETNINRVLVELFKEIKRNGSPRSLKAALARFSDLCFNIRPSKCRPYMLNLLSCLVYASQREEELLQEALGPAVSKIFSNLGSFANEGEVQGLIASFLKNLSHDSVTVRRTAGSCIHSIMSNSRRIPITLLPVIDSVFDILTQRRDNRSTILGCLPSLRAIIPLLTHIPGDGLITILAKVLMLSVYYSCHSDHTVVTSALELLEQLLKHFPHQFKHILTKEKLQPCYDIRVPAQALEENAADGSRTLQSIEVVANDAITEAEDLKVLSWKDVCSSSNDGNSALKLSSLVQLTRLLCQRFLLSQSENQLLSDSKVRVSTKTLALECMTHMVTLRPLLFTLPLTEEKAEGTSVYDVTLYLEHSDPKLRGAVLILVATYVKFWLVESSGNVDDTRENEDRLCADVISSKCPRLSDIIDMLVKSLSDEVSTCLRQSCAAVGICADALLRSKHFRLGLSLLRSVLILADNSYWLLKVDLLSLLGSLNYRQIAFLESHQKQNQLVHMKSFQDSSLSAMLSCLSEDDARVRKAAAEALVCAAEGISLRNNVENNCLSLEAFCLCHEHLGKELLGTADDVASYVVDLAAEKSLLKTYRGFECSRAPKQLEDCVSLIVCEITQLLSHSTSKSLTQGCLSTLKLLSLKYPPGRHPLSWGCYFSIPDASYNKTRSSSNASSTSHEDPTKQQDPTQNLGPLPLLMGLLHSSWLPLDLSAHSDTITLAGNLLAGAASYGLRYHTENQNNRRPEESHKSSYVSNLPGWSSATDHVISKYARELFLHLIKLLSICHHVVADVSPHAFNKSVLPTISANTTLPSPMKKKDRKDGGSETIKPSPPSARKLLPSATLPKSNSSKEETEKEKPSKKQLGSFHHNRVLMKLYDLLLGGYANYKGSMEFGNSDRFCLFVSNVLDVFCQLLEIASSQDVAPATEEVLGYLKSLFSVQPANTVQCVQQLLKALFGTNLLSQFEISEQQRTWRSSKPPAHRYKPTISHQVFHLPLNNLTISLANSSFHNSITSASKEGAGWFGSIKKKVEEKLNQSSKQPKGNKISNYIRLFEPLVIKSLKMYTLSSSVDFQKHVLNMLAQLVQLRVNYNMLDSDQVFIGYIIRQFESIETGMMRNSDSLVPHVFFFLVLLTYEKYHSKSVISMSKVIQLCDGLMASGRGIDTHVIPALDPIVHDLFVVRSSSKRGQDETTQREVLMQMIVRLLQHPQVYQMATTVLRFYHSDDVDRWKQASRHIVDVILPIVANLEVYLSGPDDVSSLFALFESLSPTALRPTTTILNVLFSPTPKVTLSNMHCWLAKILLVLRLLVCNVRETELVEALGQVKDKFHVDIFHESPSTPVENGAQFIAWFFHQVIGDVSHELATSLRTTTSTSTSEMLLFIVKEFIELLILLTYIHRSGTYKKFTSALREILQSRLCLRHIENFLLIGEFFPILTLIWGQYLAHVGHINQILWEKLAGTKSNDSSTFNQSLVHAGSLVLLCDYVFCLHPENLRTSVRGGVLYSSKRCQNVSQSELTSWLIAHHLHDVIELSGEAPVEDFLSTIQQSPASETLLSAVTSYCANHTSVKASFMQRLVRFISSLPESIVMLELLLSPSFVFSPIIAVSRASEQVACYATESLLARQFLEVTKVITSDDVNRMLDCFPVEQEKRFARLQSLLVRLRDHVANALTSTLQSPHQLPSIDAIKQPADKVWLKDLLLASCAENKWTPGCAKVLSRCEYNDVIEVMNNKKFASRYLDVCIAYGISESTSNSDQPTCLDDSLSSIMKASRERMLKLMDDVLDRTQSASTPEQKAKVPSMLTESQLHDASFTGDLVSLSSCLARYLHANSSLLHQYQLPESAYPQCLKISLLACQVIGWQLSRDLLPSVSVSTSCLEVLQQVLKFDDACFLFATMENEVLSLIETLHLLVTAYVGKLPLQPPYFPQPSFHVNDRFKACFIKMSQMFDYLRHTNELFRSHLPLTLVGPLHNVILHLCRSNVMNSYIRAPRLLWKYGWNPKCKNGTQLPDIPPDYLQEKEVLSDYISIINHIGWVSRTQFEETWASLLGVLVSQPLLDTASGKQSHEDAVSISCLAVRGLTSLVLHCALQPHAGAPTTGSFAIYHRHLSIKSPHSKWVRKLVRVRRILHEELMANISATQHCDAHYRYQRSPHDGDIHHCLVRNTERVIDTSLRYGLGQVAAKSFYELHGITPLRNESPSTSMSGSALLSAESDESDVFDDVERSNQGEQLEGLPRSLSPLRIRDGVDVHSCVQFLLDLYSGWFRSSDSGGGVTVARPLLCECMRSLLLVSDLFTEQQQFDWLQRTITGFYGAQHADDDVMLQYVVTLLCKTSTVLGMGGNISETLLPMLDAALSSPIVSCRVAALHGALYCLECYPNPFVRDIVNFLVETLPSQLVTVSGNPSLHNEDFILALLSLSYFTVERCQDLVTPEFISIILQGSSLIFSATDTTSRVYHAVANGLERLVLVFALSSTETDAVLKVAVEQLSHNSSLSRATAACGLMVTCMYCGRMRAAFLHSNEASPGDSAQQEDAVEHSLLAMERVSLIFERIRRGRSLDARVMTRILPPILNDFFPPTTILNKVIAEFASNLQPFPDLLAGVLHQVFQSLHEKDQSAFVNEWVILSLNNLIQRTPLSTAIWCLTCLFVSASSNHWINSLLPLVASRMKQPEPLRDWPLFCKAAIHFYSHQLHEELERRSFQSIFVNANEEPFRILLRCLEAK